MKTTSSKDIFGLLIILLLLSLIVSPFCGKYRETEINLWTYQIRTSDHIIICHFSLPKYASDYSTCNFLDYLRENFSDSDTPSDSGLKWLLLSGFSTGSCCKTSNVGNGILFWRTSGLLKDTQSEEWIKWSKANPKVSAKYWELIINLLREDSPKSVSLATEIHNDVHKDMHSMTLEKLNSIIKKQQNNSEKSNSVP